MNICKVILVGESGVGKTCIMLRFVQNRFDKNMISTIGASYVNKIYKFNLNDKEENLQFMILDTTGQEKYRALTRNFYIGTHVAILVYDSNIRESFEKIKDFWYNEIIEHCSKDIIIALAGNKFEDLMNIEISEEEGKKFAEENNMIFQCTSALTGLGINDLFKDIGKTYIKEIYLNKNRKNNANEKLKKQEDKKLNLNNSKGNKKKKKFC